MVSKAHPGARTRASLFDAALSLEQASSGPAGRWQTTAADALKVASHAVEGVLDDLGVPGGVLHSAGSDLPQLAPRLRAAERSLGAVLVDVWEAEASAAGPISPSLSARLLSLAGELRTLGDETFDLVHQSSDADGPGAID